MLKLVSVVISTTILWTFCACASGTIINEYKGAKGASDAIS